MINDTIIAISTPLGYGGLGVVRLSGEKSLSIAKKIFHLKKNKTLIPPCHPILGNLYNFEKKELFEEAYLTFFPKPHTYTREDVVEISCHGSPVILEEVVRLGIKSGARHANPGEFTIRAYLNGRIDILQAEAINDIINASSLSQAEISFKQLEGGLSNKIIVLREQIIFLLGHIEASIEFPEDGLRISPKQITKTIESSIGTVKDLIESYDIGKILTEGLSLAITGKVNVGKSTLFNLLLKTERAIVTPHPGTTRDYLKEKIKINDSIFTLIDMAGIKNTSHPVEKEGIKRGKKLISEANGILLLLDASQKESREDISLIKKLKNKKTLLLFNKTDLPINMNIEKIKKMDKSLPSLKISALKGTNLDKLKEAIQDLFVPTLKQNKEIILHLWQKLILEDILSHLSQGKNLIDEGYSEEVYAEEIRKIIPLLGQLTGKIHNNEIIETIFSRFCVGK